MKYGPRLSLTLAICINITIQHDLDGHSPLHNFSLRISSDRTTHATAIPFSPCVLVAVELRNRTTNSVSGIYASTATLSAAVVSIDLAHGLPRYPRPLQKSHSFLDCTPFLPPAPPRYQFLLVCCSIPRTSGHSIPPCLPRTTRMGMSRITLPQMRPTGRKLERWPPSRTTPPSTSSLWIHRSAMVPGMLLKRFESSFRIGNHPPRFARPVGRIWPTLTDTC